MENINLFELQDFPDDMKLYGSSKFRTPRCVDERVPIIVLPECTTCGVSTWGNKSYLQVTFSKEQASKFDKITNWLQKEAEAANEDGIAKSIHPIIQEVDCDKFQARIKLPEVFSVINSDGTESNCFHSTHGATMRCAVEMHCLWENKDSIGLSLQMLQCKITQHQKCLIQPMHEYPDYVPF